ncbi:substrate-binding domain-containing protein (plasmid) [Pseudonocardia bannensis]|nr:substrate-binding domain-containing protein [Pseudonocardia sp. H11422]
MNDLMAIGAMEHCREVGLRVPEDVSVVGFGELRATVRVRDCVCPALVVA